MIKIIFPAELAVFDYDAAKLNWLEYLRDVYRRTSKTPDAAKVAEYGKLVKAGNATNNALINLVETVIKKYPDLYAKFFDYLIAMPPDLKVNNFYPDFWTMFDYFTGGELFYDDENLFYFKPDCLKFFQLVMEEWGIDEESDTNEFKTCESQESNVGRCSENH